MRESKNSNESPAALEEQGMCGTCGDQGLWTNFGGEQVRVECPDCGE
jgi:hypothetical protein